MNERNAATIRAMIDLVWTATVVGIIAYAGRRELRAFIARKRAEIDARTAAVQSAETQLRARLGFARSRRDEIIAEEFDVITQGRKNGLTVIYADTRDPKALADLIVGAVAADRAERGSGEPDA